MGKMSRFSPSDSICRRPRRQLTSLSHQHLPNQVAGTEIPVVGRSALILYSDLPTGVDGSERKTLILLGKGVRGLTTIGGRAVPGESWLDCLVREVREETRGLLDYGACKNMFLSPPARAVVYSNCVYILYPADPRALMEVASKFLSTTSSLPDSDEMSELCVVSASNVIEELVCSPRTNIYNPLFRAMFMDVGFDALWGNNCNRFTDTLNIEVKHCSAIWHFPPIVCVAPFDDNFPRIYAYSENEVLFVTDQYYFSRSGRRLFRNGWHPR